MLWSVNLTEGQMVPLFADIKLSDNECGRLENRFRRFLSRRLSFQRRQYGASVNHVVLSLASAPVLFSLT